MITFLIVVYIIIGLVIGAGMFLHLSDSPKHTDKSKASTIVVSGLIGTLWIFIPVLNLWSKK